MDKAVISAVLMAAADLGGLLAQRQLQHRQWFIDSCSSAAGDATPSDATRYLYTSSSIPDGVAALPTLDLSSISFYWGSIDDYESVDVLGVHGVMLATTGRRCHARNRQPRKRLRQ